jgi:7-carboxy-7-deazaguanine synthase
MSEVRYRVSEMFMSMQGEGQFAGTPSLWVRTFGCNLTCPGFPCDTEYSWNGEYKNDHNTYTSLEIFDKLKALNTNALNPTGSLDHPVTGNAIHIVFTGGEPLLKKYQQMIQEVIDLFVAENDTVNFTIETNGTQSLTSEFANWIDAGIWMQPFFSISPKLQSVSGEKGAINVSNIMHLVLSTTEGQLKFVVDASTECEQELLHFVKLLNDEGYSGEYWAMPLGETRDDQLNIAPIVEKYQALGFKIALRGHTYVWSNEKNR